MTDTKGAMQVDAALVRQLAELLDENRLTEIEVEDGERKIRVARKAAAQYAAPPPASAYAPVAAPAHVDASAAPAPIEQGNPVKSPMVGTVYLSPDPDSKPFVTIGDSVTEGQTLVIIEAMKVMNPIVAPRAGTITRVCIDNGQPVEFDQSLVILA